MCRNVVIFVYYVWFIFICCNNVIYFLDCLSFSNLMECIIVLVVFVYNIVYIFIVVWNMFDKEVEEISCEKLVLKK